MFCLCTFPSLEVPSCVLFGYIGKASCVCSVLPLVQNRREQRQRPALPNQHPASFIGALPLLLAFFLVMFKKVSV